MMPGRIRLIAVAALLSAAGVAMPACIGIVGDFPVADLHDASIPQDAAGEDRAIVDGNSPVDSGTDAPSTDAPFVDAGSDAPPPTCGVQGLACCDGGCVADAGIRCLDDPPKCLTCVPDGGTCTDPGDTTKNECCAGTTCDSTTLRCVPCGALNQPCCAGASPCGSDAGLHCCTADAGDGTCFYDNDPLHCGAACELCQFSNGCCPASTLYACTDTQSDPKNCHGCGQICDSGSCMTGVCQ